MHGHDARQTQMQLTATIDARRPPDSCGASINGGEGGLSMQRQRAADPTTDARAATLRGSGRRVAMRPIARPNAGHSPRHFLPGEEAQYSTRDSRNVTVSGTPEGIAEPTDLSKRERSAWGARVVDKIAAALPRLRHPGRGRLRWEREFIDLATDW